MGEQIAEFKSARQIADSVRKRRISARSVVEHALDRARSKNDSLNAFRELLSDEALNAADRLDIRLSSGEDVGPLAGVPIAVKDNIATRAGQTCCGSRMLSGYRSPFDATAVTRLSNAGAIIIGRTNCDEFGMGSSTEHCAFGVVRHPADPTRVPGGSSGGSAAAVAAGLSPVALGSDTGGSIRQPAAFCGVVGVKPSYGRVSRFGLVAFASSLDQIGPIARDVHDAALLLQVIAGVDQHDATSSNAPVPDYVSLIDHSVEDLRIGVAKEHLVGVDPEVQSALDQALAAFVDAGATIVDVELPLTKFGVATYYLIASAEASSNLARFDSIRYGVRDCSAADAHVNQLYDRSRSSGLGLEVQRRIMLGTYALSAGYYDAYYKRAAQVRRLIKQEFDAAFERCHVIVSPVAPSTAFEFGAKGDDPLSMYLGDALTVNASIAGICGMSLPCVGSARGLNRLPVGVQLLCPAFEEETMFRVARQLELALLQSQS